MKGEVVVVKVSPGDTVEVGQVHNILLYYICPSSVNKLDMVFWLYSSKH